MVGPVLPLRAAPSRPLPALVLALLLPLLLVLGAGPAAATGATDAGGPDHAHAEAVAPLGSGDPPARPGQPAPPGVLPAGTAVPPAPLGGTGPVVHAGPDGGPRAGTRHGRAPPASAA